MDKTGARPFLGAFKFKPWILNDKHTVVHLKWMMKLNSNDVITKSSASKTVYSQSIQFKNKLIFQLTKISFIIENHL